MTKAWVKTKSLVDFYNGEIDMLVIYRGHSKELSYLVTTMIEIEDKGLVCSKCGELLTPGRAQVCFSCDYLERISE